MSDTLELGTLPKDTFSFSQFSMWARCPQQYAYRYLEGLKDRPNSNLIVGRVTHKGLEWGYKQQMAKGSHPKKKDVQEATVAALESELKDTPNSEIDWKGGDTPGKVKDDSVGLIEVYDPFRVQIQPSKVESKFELTLKDTEYKIIGFVDLETKPGAIIDYKTTAKTPSDGAADKSEQLTLYQIQGEGVKSLEIHSLVRLKTPKVVISKAPPRTEAQVDSLMSDMAKTAILIKTGIFPKALEGSPNSPCSWCGFYERCRGKKRAEKED